MSSKDPFITLLTRILVPNYSDAPLQPETSVDAGQGPSGARPSLSRSSTASQYAPALVADESRRASVASVAITPALTPTRTYSSISSVAAAPPPPADSQLAAQITTPQPLRPQLHQLVDSDSMVPMPAQLARASAGAYTPGHSGSAYGGRPSSVATSRRQSPASGGLLNPDDPSLLGRARDLGKSTRELGWHTWTVMQSSVSSLWSRKRDPWDE